MLDMYKIVDPESEKLDEKERKQVELIAKLNEYKHFISAFRSESAFDLFIELNNNRRLEEMIKKIEENIRKYPTEKIQLTFKDNELLKEYSESELKAFERGLTIGLNLGKILAFELIDCIIKNKLVQIDCESNNPALKLLRIYLYFFGDERNVNDVEREIIKQLNKLGFSYREIAKITGRSLDTIHRYIKT